MNINDLLSKYKWTHNVLKIDGEDVAFVGRHIERVHILKTFLKHFNVLSPNLKIHGQIIAIAHGEHIYRSWASNRLFMVDFANKAYLAEGSYYISNLSEYVHIHKIIEGYWDLLEGTAMLYQKALKKSDEGIPHTKRMVRGELFDPLKVLETLGLDAHMGIREYQLIEYKERYIHKLIHDIMDKAVCACDDRRIPTVFEFGEHE